MGAYFHNGARSVFLESARVLRSAGRVPAQAILVLGPERFERLRDSIGHERSRALIAELGQRLERLVPQAAPARVGEAEFALLLGCAESADGAAGWRALQEALALPFGGELRLCLSAGVASLSGEGSDPEHVLDAAMLALEHSRRGGLGTCEVFHPALLREARERVALESALAGALERRELGLHYQPVIDCKSGRLRGLEALARWQHPTLGRIGPDRFVPLAEESGLIHELGLFVLDEVLRQRGRWKRAGGPLAGVEMSFNVSGRQLDDDRLVCALERAAERGELAGPQLWIELTESAPAADAAAAHARLQRMRALGLRVALDDLGTGYSSLLRLRTLPLDALKIDRVLMTDVGTDERSTRMFEALCALARGLSLCIVAEGIETQAQLEVLRREGCPAAQGYLWSPALPARDLEQWNEQRARQWA